MSDPAPTCPALTKVPNAKHRFWQNFWQDAKSNFAAGKKTAYPAGGGELFVGPDYVHNVLHFKSEKDRPPFATPSHEFHEEKKTLAKWLEDAEPCEGSVKKIVSGSTFHLKGSGWFADGY